MVKTEVKKKVTDGRTEARMWVQKTPEPWNLGQREEGSAGKKGLLHKLVT